MAAGASCCPSKRPLKPSRAVQYRCCQVQLRARVTLVVTQLTACAIKPNNQVTNGCQKSPWTSAGAEGPAAFLVCPGDGRRAQHSLLQLPAGAKGSSDSCCRPVQALGHAAARGSEVSPVRSEQWPENQHPIASLNHSLSLLMVAGELGTSGRRGIHVEHASCDFSLSQSWHPDLTGLHSWSLCRGMYET